MAIKHLLLMRHAKSSWSDAGLRDHERPLNGRGRRAARTIGQILRLRGFAPDIIWSSDSVRTRETVARAFSEMKPEQIIWLENFYHASANQVLYQCAQLGEPEGNLLLMGHNPGWEDLLYHFSGRSFAMPTGACAVFRRRDMSADWLRPEAWHLQDFLKPRDFE